MHSIRWRIWFWSSIAGCTIAVAGLSAWLVIQHRYEIEVWWYRRQLGRVTTSKEAERLVARFASSPGASQRWAAFWRTFGDASVRADYWTFAALPPDDDQNVIIIQSFITEAQKRPRICSGYIHLMRWDRGFDDAASEKLLDGVRTMLIEQVNGSDEAPDPLFEFILCVLCWGTGQDDLCRELRPGTLRSVFEKWNRWYEENGPYLWFDSDVGRYRVDDDARASKTPVPTTARRIPPVDTPLPGWTGPLPPQPLVW